MVLRTAKQGPNAGGEFWGCSRWPACTSIQSQDRADASRSGGKAGSRRRWRRVGWNDATLTRPGWRCYYASAGVSLRSVPSLVWRRTTNCWVASTGEGRVPQQERAAAVVGVMRKLLARGVCPPMHADAERLLLRRRGVGVCDAEDGEVAPRLSDRLWLSADDLAVAPGGVGRFDVGLVDSPAERALVEWLQRHNPRSLAGLTPQASLDMLAAASRADDLPADDAGQGRRCDFLLAGPALTATVIEVDGSQHAQQRAVDAARDRLMRETGLPTIRIPASEMFTAAGAGVDALEQHLEASAPPKDAGHGRLVWAAVQTHRLVLAVCEAISAGWLSGDRWDLRVDDPTGAAPRLLGPYLEMFDALDMVWGGRAVMPAEVGLHGRNSSIVWRRAADCEWTAHETAGAGSPDGLVDVEVRLEPGNGPAAELPDDDCGVPRVLVRSAWLPMPTADLVEQTPQRLNPFIGHGDPYTAVRALMRGLFAVAEPRAGQVEAITETLAGRDCVVLLPTGAGKSLIYQLAGLCSPGRTLVVDPLVSLIDDQIESLARHGITRVAGVTQQTARTADVADAYFVFLSPERLQRQRFRNELAEQSTVAPVNLAVVDEAHCVSEWGHDFRTAYLNFGAVLRRVCAGALGPPPILALTGTASQAVRNDMMFQLGIDTITDNTMIRPQSLDRPELAFHVVVTDPATAAARLRAELAGMHARFGEPAGSFFEPGRGLGTFSGIVFCPTVNGFHGTNATSREVEAVTGETVRFAGTKPKDTGWSQWRDEKALNARRFKDNDATVMVATKAFGMGIDKPNVRWVLHYGLPSSIESFYQEAGRAGRAGNTAHCVLILTETSAAASRRRLDAGAANNTRGGARDDISTALWFHGQSFPDPDAEHKQVLLAYDQIESGDIAVTLGHGDDRVDERALHRLAVLGVITDYTIDGPPQASKATVRHSDPAPEQVVEHLLSYVDRTQPGRVAAVRSGLGLPYRTTRDAVSGCTRALLRLVYETVAQARLRSLREMWLSASDAAANGGDTIRRRVLDYLSEGDASAVLQQLTQRPEFRFGDWIPKWEQINTQQTTTEWRSSAGRLLVSYPDHPGLLATRALTEALLARGDAAECEPTLRRSLHQATTAYSTDNADVAGFVQWILSHVFPANSSESSPLAALAAHGCMGRAGLAAAVVAAARGTPAEETAQQWSLTHRHLSATIAARVISDTMIDLTTVAQTALDKYAQRSNR